MRDTLIYPMRTVHSRRLVRHAVLACYEHAVQRVGSDGYEKPLITLLRTGWSLRPPVEQFDVDAGFLPPSR